MKGTPFHAIVGGARFPVRAAVDGEPGNFTLVMGEQRFPIDHPAELLRAAQPGEKVVADFGRFSLTVWRDERVWYRAAADGAVGPDDTDDERACWRLLDVLGEERAPHACFFCRWSEVEPSTGWGNLGCAVKHAAEYDAVATSSDARRRKWGAQALLEWVDEWFSCERFAVRPKGYGYRGRS